MLPAPPLKRFLAFLVDIFIVLSITIALSKSVRFLFKFVAINLNTPFYSIIPIIESVEFWVSVIATLGYITICNWYCGATFGKSIFGLRVVDLNDNQLSLRASFFRTLSYALTSSTYGIGFLIGLIRKDRLALHDFASCTKVVKIASLTSIQNHSKTPI